jgi:hypothetical protein
MKITGSVALVTGADRGSAGHSRGDWPAVMRPECTGPRVTPLQPSWDAAMKAHGDTR